MALPRESDGMLGVNDGDSFIVTPADPEKIWQASDTVAAHTLYESCLRLITTELPGEGLDMSLQSSFIGENGGRRVLDKRDKF